MDTWIKIIVGFVSVLITNGAFYYTINRKIKEVAVDDARIKVIKQQDDEWQELYREERSKREMAEANCKELALKNEALIKQNGELNLKCQLLTWYRCTVNNCPKRRPPHVFDMDGNEIESCS